MTCISCNTTQPTTTYTKSPEESFTLREWIKKEIIFEGIELFHIDKGTTFSKGLASQDNGAITNTGHQTKDDPGMYYTGSIGYNLNVTYIGIHQCGNCKSYWWLELTKKNDLQIVDYVGPFQDAATQHFDLEATIQAKVISSEVAEAFQQYNLNNYYLIASKTDFFDRFYDLHLHYFESILKTESDSMIEFYSGEKFILIQHAYFVRSQWEEFMKRALKKKKGGKRDNKM